ncbi:MAG: TRAFs-binding domain-containing protein [Gammaproteobacteria bacterium]|nr:TRAFs-binding domain-containing protein [Gammaproteobacteria bacterium]
MKLHAFIAMPFGMKTNRQGAEVDFNRVYKELIRPALEAAGLEVFRADQEQRAGDIRADMFQELLIADLVVADLSADNPNVWYELGVRHGLRARGVVLISSGAIPTAFDVYTDRKLRYGLKDGAPDPVTVEEDKAKLKGMVEKTLESWHGRKQSPVYHLLPHLQEPDWKTLRIGDARDFWERYDDWELRVELACKYRCVGDILVLADEAPVAAFRAEAWIRAGQALRKVSHFDFALEQLERGLKIEPDNLTGLEEQGMCLQRLALAGAHGHSPERARAHYRGALAKHPEHVEFWALLGRVDKDTWTRVWRQHGRTEEEMRGDAAYEDALLRAAIYSYTQGFRADPRHYYSGINALTLMHLYRDLTGDARYAPEMSALAGAVRFAAMNEPDEHKHFWALATLGDLEVLIGTPEKVTAAYKEAIARNDKDWFALDSSRSQLELLVDLGFRPAAVEAGRAAFERAMERLTKPNSEWTPRRVFLFSGHMIDAPDRLEPRFSPEKGPAAAQRIAEALDAHGAGPADLALTQGACGGDLLFTEACQARGTKVHWLQPFREPEFIQKSVVRGGETWRGRYLEARKHLAAAIRAAPEALGEIPKGVGKGYPYERCNLWLLYTALAWGLDRLHFICLWNGAGGDEPGGTEHLYNEVKERTGEVTWIDARKL